MSIDKRLISTGPPLVCTADTLDIFGDSSCVALYGLNYDGSDAGGNYDGTATNVTFNAPGYIDYAASFNGSSSSILISSPISGTTDYDFSFSCWFNLIGLSTNGNRQFLFGPPASASEGSIRFEFAGTGSSTNFLMGRNLNGTFYYNNSTSANTTLS